MLLGLGLLVFAWGLQYKVSLYAEPTAAIHHMVKAKLLNEDTSSAAEARSLSNPSSSARAHTPSVTGTSWVVLAAAILSGAVSMGTTQPRKGESPWQFCCAGGSTAIFSRPPPRC